MADLWVILTVFAFFALCLLLVRGCDRIIGADDASELAVDPEPQPAEASP